MILCRIAYIARSSRTAMPSDAHPIGELRGVFEFSALAGAGVRHTLRIVLFGESH